MWARDAAAARENDGTAGRRRRAGARRCPAGAAGIPAARSSSRVQSPVRLRTRARPQQMPPEQLDDAAVEVEASGLAVDDVALGGVDHDLEVLLELDESLDEAGRVLEVDVVVDVAVDDEERVLEPLGVVDRARDALRLAVVERQVHEHT